MRFIKPFSGCRAGEVYPTQFKPGDECPAELETVAKSLDILETDAAWQRRHKVELGERQRQQDAAATDARLATLRALAEANQVDLGDAATEAQIVAALKKADVEIPA